MFERVSSVITVVAFVTAVVLTGIVSTINQLPENAAKQIQATTIGAQIISARDWLAITALAFLLIGLIAWAAHFAASRIRSDSVTRMTNVTGPEQGTRAAGSETPNFTPSGGGFFTPTITLGPAPQVFVSHIEVAFDSLRTEGCLLFNIGVVACTNLELEKLAVGGISLKSTALANDAKALEIKSVRLDTPNVFQVAAQPVASLPKEGATFPLYRGVSTVILKQYVAPSVQTSVNIAVANKKQSLEFDFTGLKLNVLVPEVGAIRLPLWDGVTCRPGMAFSRIISMSLSVGPSEPTTLKV
jgi:hypothetical protein